MIDMNKAFGLTAITRQDLEDMPCPIMASELTDEQMQDLADYVESDVKREFPDVADEMFRLWGKSINGEVFTDEERDFLITNDCEKANAYWWSAIEEYAVKELGASYYEDIV